MRTMWYKMMMEISRGFRTRENFTHPALGYQMASKLTMWEMSTQVWGLGSMSSRKKASLLVRFHCCFIWKSYVVYSDMYGNVFIGSIAVGSVANLVFGGQNMDELYMMQEDKITKVKLNIQAPDLPTTIVGPDGVVVGGNDQIPAQSASLAAWPSGLVLPYMLILSSTNMFMVYVK